MMSRYAQEMRESSYAGHVNRMKSSDFTSYKFSTYMRGQQEMDYRAGGRAGSIHRIITV